MPPAPFAGRVAPGGPRNTPQTVHEPVDYEAACWKLLVEVRHWKDEYRRSQRALAAMRENRDKWRDEARCWKWGALQPRKGTASR